MDLHLPGMANRGTQSRLWHIRAPGKLKLCLDFSMSNYLCDKCQNVDPGNFVCLLCVSIWSLAETRVLQAINCSWKIISLRASETPTDIVIFQIALRRVMFTVWVWHEMFRGPACEDPKTTGLLLIWQAIHTPGKAAGRQLSNSVSIVSSKAPQLVSLLNWKKKRKCLLIRRSIYCQEGVLDLQYITQLYVSPASLWWARFD